MKNWMSQSDLYSSRWRFYSLQPVTSYKLKYWHRNVNLELGRAPNGISRNRQLLSFIFFVFVFGNIINHFLRVEGWLTDDNLPFRTVFLFNHFSSLNKDFIQQLSSNRNTLFSILIVLLPQIISIIFKEFQSSVIKL